MPIRKRRDLQLLALGAPLRRYAATLESDQNASFLLVHHALAAAGREAATARTNDEMERSLRLHIDDGHAELRAPSRRDR